MRTTRCPICSSDIIVEEEFCEKDLVNCLNCGVELEITSLQPLTLRMMEEYQGE